MEQEIFSEGGRKGRPKVVRIGSRSKSEKVQECNINKIWVRNQSLVHNKYRLRSKMERMAKHIQCRNFGRALDSKPSSFFLGDEGLSRLGEVMNPAHYYQLTSAATTEEESQHSLDFWLGLYDEEIVEASEPAETEDNVHSEAEDKCDLSHMLTQLKIEPHENMEEETIDVEEAFSV